MSTTEEAARLEQPEQPEPGAEGGESTARESTRLFGEVAFDPMVFETVPPELIAKVKAMLAEARPVSSN